MSPALSAVVECCRDLAWHPHANLRPEPMRRRKSAALQLRAALLRLTAADALTGPIELICLIRAAWRAAACSYASRMGLRYYQRKQAMAELRGCLIAFDRAWTAAVA